MIYDDATAVLNALKTFLSNQFGASYGDSMAQFGGADVVLETTEARAEERVGRPCISLALESDDDSQWSGGNPLARDIVIQTSCEASDWSGAQVGAANPEGSPSILARELARIVYRERAQLDALGLELSRYQGGEQTITTNDDAGGESHATKGKIFLTYWRG